MREYSHAQILVANTPYVVMVVLGTLTIAYAYEFSPGMLVGAGCYLAYGIIGALWIMAFVCPYCAYFATRSCPCGYGMISFIDNGCDETVNKSWCYGLPYASKVNCHVKSLLLFLLSDTSETPPPLNPRGGFPRLPFNLFHNICVVLPANSLLMLFVPAMKTP